MACSDYSGQAWEIAQSALYQLNFWEAVVCPFRDTPLVLMTFGPLGIALSIYYQSVAPMVVMVLLLGGVIATSLPAGVIQVVVIILSIGIAAGIALIARRVRTP